MSVRTVAARDLRNAGRSRGLWAGAIALGLLAVALAFTNQGTNQTPTAAVRSLFDALTTLLALLLPIVALAASYLAVAGERESGGIKFLLSVPNSRRDVLVGKLLSRLVLVTVGVAFVYVPATTISLTKHGAFPAGVVLGTLAVTLVYGAVFVIVGVSLSATVASRGSAIGRSLLAYFLLVLFYIFPVIQIRNIVRTVHTTILGMSENTDLYNAVEYTSPYLAYQKALNLVVPESLRRDLFLDSGSGTGSGGQEGASGGSASGTASDGGGADAGQAAAEASEAATDLPVYLTDEFAVVILAVWLVVPLVVGYWSFNGADLE
jgi:ABC-2 type transport system permease protein